MIRTDVFMLVIAAAACGSDADPDAADRPDAPPSSPACVEAAGYRDLASLESKVFKASCVFSGCHDGSATAPGMLDLRAGHAFASMVGVPSRVDPSRKIVVPGQPSQSTLLLMIGQIEPDRMAPPAGAIPQPGLMPLTGGEETKLCAEKRGAIERWITAGAAND